LLGTLLTAGMHVEIHRARPVTLQVDGKAIQTRTQARDVAQLLSEVGVLLSGKDYAIPSLATQVTGDLAVRIVRVVEDWIVETEDIPYETVRRADSKLELDQQNMDQRGQNGVRKRRVHIVYEDGKQKEREVTEEWVERHPTTRIISYGTKIVIRELETPDGVIRYWRKMRMLATSYTAATSGKKSDHPEYGITRLGWRARKGIIAVDPLVIKLRTNMYVFGYGFGVAADTGGKIKGRWIDLCYEEYNLVLWKRWLDVYLLEPVPAAKDIPLTLPSYPTERR
jgi:3D (Asp-Asp-Asp) domain-containing protein